MTCFNKGEFALKILAIDTSSTVASVAILDEDKIAAEYSINYKMTHSVTLMQMLENIIKISGIELSEIDAFAIDAGPGSFTGLKIGSATIKALAYACNKPVISVETTLSLAYNIYMKEGLVCPVMDARRDRVYSGIYEYDNYKLKCLLEQDAYELLYLIDKINLSNKNVVFVGDGVDVYKELIIKNCKNAVFAYPHLLLQRASSVAFAAKMKYEDGKYDTAFNHKPIYLRESSAVVQRKNLKADK